MDSFFERSSKVVLIMIIGTVTMAIAISFAALLLKYTPMPDGFESGFAILALALAGMIIGMYSGYSDYSVLSGFWYSELFALVLLVVSHLVSGRTGIYPDNLLVVFVAGLSGVSGAIFAKSFRKIFERIRVRLFKRRLL